MKLGSTTAPQHETSQFDAVMSALLRDSWTAFDAALAERWLVRPAIPILYFGDLVRYLESELRVITVGLNPSGREFPVGNPFQRFPAGATVDPHRLGWEEVHQRALNSYFREDPYRLWFGAWEPVLSGMNASYWDDESVALHTDLCSPLATNPTWDGLDPSAKSRLEPTGHRLWARLAGLLAPHVVLVSLASSYLPRICALPLTQWSICHVVEGPTRRPLEVRATWVNLSRERKSLLVFGRAANVPLGTVSHKDKARIGQSVKAMAQRERE
jgi:hypothetical protein